MNRWLIADYKDGIKHFFCFTGNSWCPYIGMLYFPHNLLLRLQQSVILMLNSTVNISTTYLLVNSVENTKTILKVSKHIGKSYGYEKWTKPVKKRIAKNFITLPSLLWHSKLTLFPIIALKIKRLFPPRVKRWDLTNLLRLPCIDLPLYTHMPCNKRDKRWKQAGGRVSNVAVVMVSQGMPESKRLTRTGFHYLEEVNLVYFSKVLNPPWGS